MDILTFINSLTNEDLNRIRNSKSDAEARRLLREHKALQLQQTGVIVQSEQLKTCEHNFADVYDHTGNQIVGKKCLNGCGF